MFRITEIRTLERPDYKVLSDFQEKLKMGIATEEELREERKLARYESVMKVLKPNQCYRLVSNTTPDRFYNSLWADNMPDINISAIVGENGMGKSALVDLMIRIINNTAYALRWGLDRGNDEIKNYQLRFVRDIYASITFENAQATYTITQKDSKVWCTDDSTHQVEWMFDFDCRLNNTKGLFWGNKKCICVSEGDIKEKCKGWLSHLFYTIEINYSAYGNNTLDIQPEYTDEEELEEGENKEEVDGDTRIWMHNIFHKNDAYQLPLVLSPYRATGKINYNNEQDLSRDRLCRLAMMNPSPLEDVLEGKKPDSILFDINPLFSCPPKPGIGVYVVSPRLEKECLRLQGKAKGDLKEMVNGFSQEILSLWSDMLGYDLSALGIELNRKSKGDGARVLSYLVYKTVKIANTYPVYRETATSLAHLFQSFGTQTDSSETLVNEKPSESQENGMSDGNRADITEYMRSLLGERTHVTLKLRRTLALLMFQHYTTEMKRIPLKEFNEIIKDKLRNQNSLVDELRKKYKSRTQSWDFQTHVWSFDELMPSPSMRPDVLFTTDDGHTLKASYLSSGERQLIAVLSAVIYHLYNLNSEFDEISIEKKGMLPYPYVNVIFDEAELYFHPKYQTQFINALLTAIRGLTASQDIYVTKPLKGINIIFVTHSPFLLSDIPQGNILCMKDGMPSNELKRTFCANVYDILADSFFMKRFVGDFAYNKVGEIIDRINSQDFNAHREEDLRRLIELIGDDFIRENLLMRFKSRGGEWL